MCSSTNIVHGYMLMYEPTTQWIWEESEFFQRVPRHHLLEWGKMQDILWIYLSNGEFFRSLLFYILMEVHKGLWLMSWLPRGWSAWCPYIRGGYATRELFWTTSLWPSHPCLAHQTHSDTKMNRYDMAPNVNDILKLTKLRYLLRAQMGRVSYASAKDHMF